MDNIEDYNNMTFENIKHIDEFGNEYWYARELMIVLEYTKWGNFKRVIEKAKFACELSENIISNHFADVGKTIKMPKGAIKEIDDYKLSRYACYLIVQNADPRKKVVAFGQTYFAVKTRKQEITEEYFNSLDENKKRLITRGQTIDKNKTLYKTANRQIAIRKNLNEKVDILDYMGSEELADNLFRIVQTEAKLKKENVNNETEACKTHYTVGKTVRKAIQELGGTMPEDLPTPEKSIKGIEKEELLKITNK